MPGSGIATQLGNSVVAKVDGAIGLVERAHTTIANGQDRGGNVQLQRTATHIVGSIGTDPYVDIASIHYDCATQVIEDTGAAGSGQGITTSPNI